MPGPAPVAGQFDRGSVPGWKMDSSKFILTVMTTGLNTIVAAAIIAASILISHHFDIVAQAGGAAIRLNRWTGAVDVCTLEVTPSASGDVRGSQLRCEPK